MNRVLMLVLFIGLPSAGLAQDLTCDDISFTSMVTSQYPNVAGACLDVVERDGRRYAKLEATVVRIGSTSAVLRFTQRDGSRGPRVRVDTTEGPINVLLGGRRARLRSLERGQKIRIYLPGDRWELAYVDEGNPFEPVTTEDFLLDRLPSTASPLFALAIAGLGFLGLGGVLTVLRRSRRNN